MKKKIDNTNAKKLINEYSNKVNFYLKENESLKNQLEDIKTTLKINKELLFNYIQSTNDDKNEEKTLNELKNENNSLLEKIDAYLAEKRNLEKKIFKIQQDLEDRIIQDRENLEKASEDIFILQNKINEKDIVIEQLKRELEKIFNYHENSIQKEILITEPNKINIDLNNELNYTRDILAKISKMLQVEKAKNDQLEIQVNQLQEELNTLKKNSNLVSEEKSKDNKEPTSMNSSSEDSSSSEKSYISDESNLDSLVIKFPDKVQMHKADDDKAQFKLDFTKVNAKYNSAANNMKGKYNANVVVQKKKDNKEKKKVDKKNEDSDLDVIIEKLKNDLKNSNKTVKDLTSKLEKQKNLNKDMKQKISKLNENLKMVNTKIETLETQIKKVSEAKSSSSLVIIELKKNNSSSFVIETEENHVFNTESNINDVNNLYLNTENPNHGYNTIEYDNLK